MNKPVCTAVVAAVVVGLAFGGGGGKPSVSTFTDKRDGKVYRIAKVGGQTWMAENLNYAAKGSKCYNNNADCCAEYGSLYDWNTAMNGASSSKLNPSGVKGICPDGWHLPSNAEWRELADFDGSKTGTKLRSSTGWERCDCDEEVPAGTDDYGFSALPDPDSRGNRSGTWWSATENGAGYARIWCITSSYEYMTQFRDVKSGLRTVRCVQDKEAQK